MKKLWYIILSLILALILYDITDAYSPIIATDNTTTAEQAIEFLKDRNATKSMLDCVPFIYDYCEEVGIDATIVIGISSLETGYGKSNLFVRKNNPGGMKARRGWMKFDTLEDGYRTMINKIGAMAGVIKSNSFYYNTCYYVKDLGNIYWVENGCDRGYYNNLIRQMNKIASYEIVNEEQRKEIIVEKEERKLTPKEYIMSFKSKKGNGMKLINDILSRDNNKDN